MEENIYQIIVYVPEADAEKVKLALFEAGAGRLGNYSHCCWQTTGIGQFKPLPNSNPAIGVVDQVEKVRELRLELICSVKNIDAALNAIRKTHPYETPAFSYWRINNL